MGFLKWSGYIILSISITMGTYCWYVRLPGKNGLGWTTTADEAIRPGAKLDGKNIIITGGSTGIGLPNVLAFAKHKTSIWLPTRIESMERCETVVQEIKKVTGNQNIFCEEMDLSSFKSIKSFVEKWKKRDIPLHILINNAGIQCSYNETEDGHEMMFGTNHLGHFLLTNLLIEPLKKGNPSRVVTVASSVHAYSPIHWDDLKGKGTWFDENFVSYAQSKTANMLFSIELNKRMKGFGHANSVHPGIIFTTLQRGEIKNLWLFKILGFVLKYFGKSPSEGAATQVYVATAPELEDVGGEYFEDCNIATSSAAEHAKDSLLAERLWKVSEELTEKYLK